MLSITRSVTRASVRAGIIVMIGTIESTKNNCHPMPAAKQSPTIRRFRIRQRAAALGSKATNEEAEKARKSQGVESRTELRIVATPPGPVRRSTVRDSCRAIPHFVFPSLETPMNGSSHVEF